MKDNLKQLLKGLFYPGSHRIYIDSKKKLEEAVESCKILPFFPNNIRCLSVEEMCAPGMLFGGNYDEGCWEWKGPVIRERSAIYGKFFRRKAGFVSKELISDFLNYRREKYPVKPDSTESMLLDIIRENDSLTSTELKQLIFGGRKRERWDELPELNPLDLPIKKGKSLESPLQKLQMGGWIVISDFEYKRTKKGERYGWGVARYSTPEILFPEELEEKNSKEGKESLDYLIKEMKKLFPYTSKKDWLKLLE